MFESPRVSAGAWPRQRGALMRAKPLIPAGLSIGAFVIDLMTPNGMLDGFLYVLAVLSCFWVPATSAGLYTALGLTPLIVIGSAASPIGVPVAVATTNLLVGTATIWVAAIVVWRNARATQQREGLLAQIRNLQRATLSAAGNERMELSRWLHEGIGQDLAALGWGLDRLAKAAAGNPTIVAGTMELRASLDVVQQAIRSKGAELRHDRIESAGLPALLERHAGSFAFRTGIAIDIHGTECLTRLPNSEADLCFRVVQEALTNVAKHARARRAVIEFSQTAEVIRLLVTDDGHGISAADRLKPNSFGLLGLQERLLAIGGELTVSNSAAGGVQLEALLPLRGTGNGPDALPPNSG